MSVKNLSTDEKIKKGIILTLESKIFQMQIEKEKDYIYIYIYIKNYYHKRKNFLIIQLIVLKNEKYKVFGFFFQNIMRK